jgi:putative transposase
MDHLTLRAWLIDKGMEHVRGTPYHPQTQGKIERWHQTLKNRILLDKLLPAGRPRTADRRICRAL